MVMVGFHASAEKWTTCKGKRTFWMHTLDAYAAGTLHGSGVDVEPRWWCGKQVRWEGVYISGVGRRGKRGAYLISTLCMIANEVARDHGRGRAHKLVNEIENEK